MARSRNRGRLSISQQLDQLQRQRRISRDEYAQLTNLMLSGQTLSPDERYRVIQVLDDIKLGRLLIEESGA